MNFLKYFITIIISYSSLISAQSSLHNPFNDEFSFNPEWLPQNGLNNNSEFLKIDSIVAHSMSGASLKNLFTYNKNNKISEWLILGSTGSGYENYYRNDFFYDSSGHKIAEIDLSWYNGQWEPTNRIDYFYENDRLVLQILKEYTNTGWSGVSRDYFDYDSSGNLAQLRHEKWVIDQWQNYTLQNYYYSIDNRQDSLKFDKWIGGGWQNYTKSYFYYSPDRMDTDSILAIIWDGSSWKEYLKRQIINDVNHNQVQITEKVWTINSWENTNRFFYSYNSMNYIDAASTEMWNGIQWISYDAFIFFRNPDGFQTGFFTSYLEAYYSQPAGLSENGTADQTGYRLFPNYPNPFNPVTTITWQIPEGNNTTIKVYDILGNEVAVLVNEYKSAGRYETKFNAGHLSSGIYFYRIRSGSFNSIGKMILLK